VSNPKVEAFLNEVVEVCKRHGLSIGHEDGHGAFRVEDYDETNTEWLLDAIDETSTKSHTP